MRRIWLVLPVFLLLTCTLGPAWPADPPKVYVGLFKDDAVAVVDPVAGKVLRTAALAPDTKRKERDIGFDHFYPYVWNGDRVFKATKQADLFIMLKLDSKTPETDEGWVYATTTPDGQRVTAAGRIESCMNCHTINGTAATGRFGPDLTHLMSRTTIASGIAANSRANLVYPFYLE